MDNGEWMDNVDGSTLEDSLASLARLVDALDEVIKSEKEIDSKLKEIKEQRRVLEQDQIPTLLNQHGLSEVRLADGRKVIVSTDLKARIPAGAAARQVVLDWIAENGGSGLVHDEMLIEEPSQALIDDMISRGETFSRKDVVNTNSFTAFLRELLGMKKGFDAKINATDVPKEAGLYVFQKTKIQA